MSGESQILETLSPHMSGPPVVNGVLAREYCAVCAEVLQHCPWLQECHVGMLVAFFLGGQYKGSRELQAMYCGYLS